MDSEALSLSSTQFLALSYDSGYDCNASSTMSIYYKTGIFALPPQPLRAKRRPKPRASITATDKSGGVEEFAYSCQILKVLGHEWREAVDALLTATEDGRIHL